MAVAGLARRRSGPDGAGWRRGAAPGLSFLGAAALALGTAGGAAAITLQRAAAPAPPPQYTWSSVARAPNPPPLQYPSAVYDSDNATVVLFGGMQANGTLSNDTWVWDGSAWSDYPGTEIQAPPARMDAAMAFDPVLHQLILFGGRGAGGQLLGDTWAWNGASWFKEGSLLGQPTPPARQGAALSYDGSGPLVLFGGTGQGAGTPLATPPSSSAGATSTGSSTSGSTSQASDTTVTLGDTWLWTSNGWAQATGTSPPARSGAALAYDSSTRETVLFGGTSTPAGAASPKPFGDTWNWTGSAWQKAAPKVSPPARAGAALADDPVAHGLILFGGRGGSGVLADDWLWHGSAWSPVKTRGGPAARAGAAVASDAASHELVLFGGVGSTGKALGDTDVLTTVIPLPSPVTSTTRPRPTTTRPPSVRPVVRPAHPTPSTTVPIGVTTASTLPSPTGSLQTGAQQLHPGQRVKLRGGGFQPGATVQILFHSTPERIVGTATADRSGWFSTTVAVPVNAATGPHHFYASGKGTSGSISLVAQVEVVPLASAHSGISNLEKLILLAIALLLPLGTWAAMGGYGLLRRRAAPQ